LRLIKFLYTRNFHDLGCQSQTATLCLALEMSDIFTQLQQKIVRGPKLSERPKIQTRSQLSLEPIMTRAHSRKRKRL